MSTTSTWWKITCTSNDSESAACLAVELGAKGTWLTSDTSFTAYTEQDPSELKDLWKTVGIEIESYEIIPFENYVAMCQDVWQPVVIGSLIIKPILESSSDNSNLSDDEIKIIPGNGFGTGHHESTRLALSLLQHEKLQSVNLKRVLDLGTGNGILALGAARLYKSNVLAIDNDELAIQNALENVRLNPGSERHIKLIHGDISLASLDYDLILANIYTKTLCELENKFRSLIYPKGILIVAGIMTEEAQLINEVYNSNSWELVDSKTENNWYAALLQKV